MGTEVFSDRRFPVMVKSKRTSSTSGRKSTKAEGKKREGVLELEQEEPKTNKRKNRTSLAEDEEEEMGVDIREGDRMPPRVKKSRSCSV